MLAGVPKDWSGSNFDYFWIVDYGNPDSPIPTRFRAVRRVFPAPFQAVPGNTWGAPEHLPQGTTASHDSRAVSGRSGRARRQWLAEDDRFIFRSGCASILSPAGVADGGGGGEQH